MSESPSLQNEYRSAIYLYREEMLLWEKGEREVEPDPHLIASALYREERVIAQAAHEAEKAWTRGQEKLSESLYPRGKEFRHHLRQVTKEDTPLRRVGPITVYPSSIIGSEIVLIEDRRDGFYIPLPADEETKDTSYIETSGKVPENLRQDLSSWVSASLTVFFDKGGEGFVLSLDRESKEDALLSINDLLKICLKGSLTEANTPLQDENHFFLLQASKSFELLFWGEEHPAVSEAGERKGERLLQKARSILYDGSKEEPYYIASEVDVPSIGRVRVLVSSYDPESLLSRTRILLPGLTYSSSS